MKRLISSDGGAAIVELALVAPFLILLTIGIIDIGRFAHESITIGNAARAGAEFGAYSSVNSTNAPAIASAAQADATDVSLLPTDVSSTMYCSCGATPGTTVTTCNPTPTCASSDHLDSFVSVTVTKSFSSLINYPGIASTLTLTKTATQEISP